MKKAMISEKKKIWVLRALIIFITSLIVITIVSAIAFAVKHKVSFFGPADKKHYLARLDLVTEEQVTGNESPEEAERIEKKNQLIREYRDYVDDCYMQYWTQDEFKSHRSGLRLDLLFIRELEPELTPEVKFVSELYSLKGPVDSCLEMCNKYELEYVRDYDRSIYLLKQDLQTDELRKMVGDIETLQDDLLDETITLDEAKKTAIEYAKTIRSWNTGWLRLEWEERLAAEDPQPVDRLITQTVLQGTIGRDFQYGLKYDQNTYLLSDDNNIPLPHYYQREVPVECKRSFPDDETVSPYCIYKVEEGGYLYVFFHRTEKSWRTDYVCLVKEPLTQKDFETIQAGDKLDEVKEIDEGFAVSLGNWSDFVSIHQSVHIVDGGFLVIDYELTQGEWPIDLYSPDAYNCLEKAVVKSKKFVPNGERVLDYSDHYGTQYSKAVKYKLLEQDFPKELFSADAND